MEYRGGTYISQIYSNNRKNALKQWASGLDMSIIKFFGLYAKQQLLESILEDNFVAISGLRNIFFDCSLLNNFLCKVHIIDTI
jgi:hypothetical protein